MAIVINGSGTVTGLAVGGLPDGTVDAGTLAVNSRGTVLQVVSQSSSALETSSTTYADMYSATITPSSTSSKILVMVTNHIFVGADSNNTWRAALIILLRGATTIHSDLDSYGEGAYLANDSDRYMTYSSFHLLDSPATTSATVYKLQGKSKTTSATMSFNNTGYGAGGAITLMEIAG
mgnify:FL=1